MLYNDSEMEEKQLYLTGFRNNYTPKGSNRHMISLPSDMLILGGVALVLLLILSFSLGVERGKKIASVIPIAKEKNIERLEDTIKASPEKLVEEQKKDVVQSSTTPSKKEIKASEEKIGYKIQVATFYKENTASKAAKSLQKQGYPASVVKKGKFVVIYVGDFDNKAKAKQILQSLRKQYKDCILRRL